MENLKQKIQEAVNLYKSGSDIIDVGGESTRPNSKPVKSKKEWQRIQFHLPVYQGISVSVVLGFVLPCNCSNSYRLQSS